MCYVSSEDLLHLDRDFRLLRKPQGAQLFQTFKMAASRMAFNTRTAFSRFFLSETTLSCKKYDLLERAYGNFVPRRRLFLSAASKNNENEDLQRNPFYAKYADKIKMAQDIAEGGQHPRSFEEKMKVDLRVTEEANRMKAIASEHQNKQSTIGSLSGCGNSSQFSKTSLDSVLHMDRIKDLDGHQIEELWKEYHKNKDCICASIPSDVYERITSRAVEFPMFIFPLPRQNGYEFMFAEFSEDICLMTSLLQYQTSAENSPWVLAMRHFTELSKSKDIVLMVGEVDTKHLSVIDAQWLGNQVQMYYASENPERINLLKLFNKEQEKFDHMSVIDQLDQEMASGSFGK